jgi:hypothetical protein
MVEWGIPFDHIEEHWTDAQFMMFWRRLVERKEAEHRAANREHENAY